jgi:hypothetical protein
LFALGGFDGGAFLADNLALNIGSATTTGPVLGEVADIVAEATSSAGAVVTFTLPSATDDADPAPVVLHELEGIHDYGAGHDAARCHDLR